MFAFRDDIHLSSVFFFQPEKCQSHSAFITVTPLLAGQDLMTAVEHSKGLSLSGLPQLPLSDIFTQSAQCRCRYAGLSCGCCAFAAGDSQTMQERRILLRFPLIGAHESAA